MEPQIDIRYQQSRSWLIHTESLDLHSALHPFPMAGSTTLGYCTAISPASKYSLFLSPRKLWSRNMLMLLGAVLNLWGFWHGNFVCLWRTHVVCSLPPSPGWNMPPSRKIKAATIGFYGQRGGSSIGYSSGSHPQALFEPFGSPFLISPLCTKPHRTTSS